MLQGILIWVSNITLMVTIVINSGYVTKLKNHSSSDSDTVIPKQVLKIILLSCSGALVVQIFHFLCFNLQIRDYIRSWCIDQNDLTDLGVSRIDQSASNMRLNDSTADGSVKKIKIKYPLYLVQAIKLEKKTRKHFQKGPEGGC